MQVSEHTAVRALGLLDSGYTKQEVWRRVDVKRLFNSADQFINACAYQKYKAEKVCGFVKSCVRGRFSREDYLSMKKYIEEDGGSWEALAKEKGYKTVPQFKYVTIKNAKKHGIDFKPGRITRSKTWTKDALIQLLEMRKTHTWAEVYAIYKQRGVTSYACLRSFCTSVYYAIKAAGLSLRVGGRRQARRSKFSEEQVAWVKENWELSNTRKRTSLANAYLNKFGEKHKAKSLYAIVYAIDHNFKHIISREGGHNDLKSAPVMASGRT